MSLTQLDQAGVEAVGLVKIDLLGSCALSRKPRPEEATRLARYAGTGDRRRALRDVFWALLNSTEFVLNH